MTERPPIIQYWHRPDPPAQILELTATFRDRNPGMRHLFFDEQAAARFIEERYGQRHAKAFRSCAVPAMQASYFRFCAVHSLGGIYADANFACKRELGLLLEPEGQLFGRLPMGPVLNGLFAFRAGHPLLILAIAISTRNIELRLSNNIGVIGGTAILTALTHLYRGGRLDDLRAMTRPAWRADVDDCIDEMDKSIHMAMDRHGSLEEAFEGVRISSLAEMARHAEKPQLEFENPDGHWAHWKGVVFRDAAEVST